MNFRGAILLAMRFLGVRSGRSVSNARKSLFGAIAGIGISLVPLIIVLVVSDGMIDGISSRMIELGSSHLRIADYANYPGAAGYPESMERVAADISKYDSESMITGAQAERQGLGIVVGKKGRSGGTIRAVEDRFFSENANVVKLLEVVEGTTRFTGANDAFLGKKIAADIDARVGDTIRIVTMRTTATGKTIPRFTSFHVQAIVSSGYQDLDALWVFIPYRTGCNILDPQSSSNFINVQTKDPFSKIESVKLRLMSALPEGFSVYTWKEMNRAQFQSFNTTKVLLVFIMVLIVLVASVNVSSALVMLVMERRKEIAILKSTGSDPATISFAFVIAGFLTGLGGIIVGMPFGIFCAIHINGFFSLIERLVNILSRLVFVVANPFTVQARMPAAIHLLDPAYYLEKIPVHLHMNELFLIAAGTLMLSVLVSLLPAIRAGQEKPIETLRKF